MVDYYADRDSDVARAFLSEYLNAARRIAQHPHSNAKSELGARRISLRVFPYQVWYRVHEHALLVEILAVVHHRRGPRVLDDRLA
jgi:plasmid stabilization system protein ParE